MIPYFIFLYLGFKATKPKPNEREKQPQQITESCDLGREKGRESRCPR